jgi:hypothetical protein
MGQQPVGQAILQFAQAFTALNQRNRELDFQEKRFNIENDRALKSMAIREQNVKLAEVRAEQQQKLFEVNFELKKAELQKERVEAVGQVQKERIDVFDKIVKNNQSVLRSLIQADPDKPDFLANFTAALQGGQPISAQARDPKRQAEVDRLIDETVQFSKQRQEMLLGLNAEFSAVLPNTNEDVTPFAPAPNLSGTPQEPVREQTSTGPQAVPGAIGQRALEQEQEGVMSSALNVARELKLLNEELRNPNFSGDKREALKRRRNLQNELIKLKVQARQTATGGQ